MTEDGVQRIAISGGAMLADPALLGNVEPALFEPAFWAARGELREVSRGRGSAWFIDAATRQWALRHYRRGGLVARLSKDRYVWAGENRVRAFAEWRLLAALVRQGLPVPTPVAAHYQRGALLYRCDLITQRIPGAEPLSVRLVQAPVEARVWRAVGVTLARLHGAGVDHADLNAHNILIDGAGVVSVIDFDRGRVRTPGAWRAHNLARLQRSLEKIARGLESDRYSASAWALVRAGYGAR